MYHCCLCWKTDICLLIAWADTVQIALVKVFFFFFFFLFFFFFFFFVSFFFFFFPFKKKNSIQFFLKFNDLQ